jgi:hypothetical protein
LARFVIRIRRICLTRFLAGTSIILDFTRIHTDSERDLFSLVMSGRPYACLSVNIYQRGFVCKDFCEKLLLGISIKVWRGLQIWLKSEKNMEQPMWADTCIVDSSSKYFVTRRRCKGNPLLRFECNTQPFHIVATFIYVSNNEKRRNCSVPVATMDPRKRHNETWY